MTKRYLVISAVIFMFIGGCASLDRVSREDQSFMKVFDAAGFEKDKIFDAAEIWITDNLRSPKAVIEVDDRSRGVMIAKGKVRYPCEGLSCISKNDWKIGFTMRLDVKNEKFRLIFNDLKMFCPEKDPGVYYQQDQMSPPVTRGDLDAIKAELLNFGDRIVKQLKNARAQNDW